MQLPGLIVPPLTPFTADLDIDEQALERQIHYIVNACSPEMIVAAGVEAQEYQFRRQDRHVVVNVMSGGCKGVFIGDAVHHPMQLLFPELSSRADGDMDASRVTRRGLIEKHADTGNLVMPHHFATPSSGTIEKAGDDFRFTFIEGS
jgi:hypothetical protein